MKTKQRVFLVVVSCLMATIGLAQVQQWVLPPYTIDMSGSAPVTSTIPGASANFHNIAAGAYDPNGKLLFYVKDLDVYVGSNSQLKGHLAQPMGWSYQGAEVEILPIPGEELCNRFYVIYTVGQPAGAYGYTLAYTRVDWNGGNPVFTPPLGTALTSLNYPQHLLQWAYVDGQGLAVSKPALVSGRQARYLFTIGSGGSYQFGSDWGGVLRWTIDSTGIHSQVVVANTATHMNNYYKGAYYLGVTQLSLSDDQTRLAWGGGTKFVTPNQRIFEIKLNPANYTYAGSFHEYVLPTLHSLGVSGVEYAGTSNKLYASTWEGIFYIPSFGATPVLLPSSASLTHSTGSQLSGSQLQYVPSTGRIVGVGVTNAQYTGKLFSIDPSAGNTITPNYANTPLTSITYLYFGPSAFILPDRVPPLIKPPCLALNADFTYQVQYNSADGYFTVTATPADPLSCPGIVGDIWKIVELDAFGNPVPGTDTSTGATPNPPCWWIYPAGNTFKGFDGTRTSAVGDVTCSTPSPGRFANTRTYKITHGVWTDSCPWKEVSHTVSVSGH